jgi:hypothetical protein
MPDETETDEADFHFGFEAMVSARTHEPIVVIRWGDRGAQVPPFIARQLGQQAFEVAESAESDAAVFHMLTTDIGLDDEKAGAFVGGLRHARARVDSRPEASFEFHDQSGVEDEGASGKLPDKVPGQHRFMVAASYSVSAEELALAIEGEQMHLDHETRFSLVMGCLDCEQDYDACKDQPCLGDPADK